LNIHSGPALIYKKNLASSESHLEARRYRNIKEAGNRKGAILRDSLMGSTLKGTTFAQVHGGVTQVLLFDVFTGLAKFRGSVTLHNASVTLYDGVRKRKTTNGQKGKRKNQQSII